MTIALVQISSEIVTNSGVGTPSVVMNVTAGSLLVAVVRVSTASVPTVSDSLGNTWTLNKAQSSANTGNQSALVFSAPNCAAGSTTITLTGTLGSSSINCKVLEFSGAVTASPVAVSGQNTDDTTVAPTATPTPGLSVPTNALGITAFTFDRTATTSSPTSWTGVASANANIYWGYRVYTGAVTAERGAPTGSSNAHYESVLVAYSAAIVAPVLSAPTQTATGSTTATVGATTDTAPTATALSVQVLPAASAAPTAAAIVASPTQTLAAGAAGARTFALTGLTVATAYRAHFAQGSTSNVVSTVSFTTPDTTSPTLTGPVTISGITATGATASWSAGADNVSVASYETSLDGTTWTDRGNVLTYGFTGLASNTAYTVSVRAKDAAGNVSAPPIAGSLTTSVGPATATTLTGPSGGTVGSASAPFTVGLNGTGTSAITPSDSGAGGTFTPAGAQTVTYPATAAFTYTAASAGAKTISTTNSSSLTNPTAVAYSASATVGTLTIPSIANNTGTVLAGVTLPNVVVIQRSNRALLLALTNQAINGSGNLVIASGALPAGTACQVAAFENDGSLGGCWAGTVV